MINLFRISRANFDIHNAHLQGKIHEKSKYILYKQKYPPLAQDMLVSKVRNRHIHEDLGIPLFADHIRILTASFDSKLADVGNPLVRQLGRYLR
jgi:hypothetical protein